MNIEVANRLVNLRKQNNLSQEQLAEKIGVSRQAVSKWERSEASPDTDNLILLARLYNISLDELLNTGDEIPDYNDKNTDNAFDNGNDYNESDNTDNNSTSTDSTDSNNGYKWDNGKGINIHENGDHVHVGFDGIHVVDKNGSEVHVGLGGIHVNESKNGNNVHLDENGVFVNGEKKDIAKQVRTNALIAIPIFCVCFIAFIVLGTMYGGTGWGFSWLCLLAIPVLIGIVKTFVYRKSTHLDVSIVFASLIAFLYVGICQSGFWWCWLILFFIPILTTLIEAIRKRRIANFAYPVLVAQVYLYFGLMQGLWHPHWAIFVTVPLFYWIAALIQPHKAEKEHCGCNCNFVDDNSQDC